MGFQTAEEAFERKGFVKGLRRAKEEVDNLYSYTHETRVNENVQESRVANASGTDNVGGRFNINRTGNAAGFRIGDATESESRTPTGPAY